jgi:hypothetical protein
MPLNTAALSTARDAVATAAPFLAIHTATPDATGSNQSAAARVAAAWSAGVSTSKSFTGGAASGPALFVGFWSAATGGVFYGYQALTGDQTFNAAGQYTINSVSITAA